MKHIQTTPITPSALRFRQFLVTAYLVVVAVGGTFVIWRFEFPDSLRHWRQSANRQIASAADLERDAKALDALAGNFANPNWCLTQASNVVSASDWPELGVDGIRSLNFDDPHWCASQVDHLRQESSGMREEAAARRQKGEKRLKSAVVENAIGSVIRCIGIFFLLGVPPYVWLCLKLIPDEPNHDPPTNGSTTISDRADAV